MAVTMKNTFSCDLMPLSPLSSIGLNGVTLQEIMNFLTLQFMTTMMTEFIAGLFFRMMQRAATEEETREINNSSL
jgi:hypothetical protein